jgi:hypothetical protein
MENSIAHAAERKAFETALTVAFKKAQKNDNGGYVELVKPVPEGSGQGMAG